MVDDNIPTRAAQQYYVYLSQCANAELYVGSTQNVERRLTAHNQGQGGRYTRARRPLRLLAVFPFTSRAEARRAERRIKRLTPAQKYALAESTKLLREEDI
jgi:putative endonuclease